MHGLQGLGGAGRKTTVQNDHNFMAFLSGDLGENDVQFAAADVGNGGGGSGVNGILIHRTKCLYEASSCKQTIFGEVVVTSVCRTVSREKNYNVVVYEDVVIGSEAT